jgi:CPA2 family monovalent cation:H+ antiporter-2
MLLLALDTILIVTLVISTALKLDMLAGRVGEAIGLTPQAARWLLIVLATATAAPLCVGILRITRVLSHDLAARAFPEMPTGEVDVAAAPRNTLEVTLHLLMVVVIGGLIVAVTQPFIPLFRGTILLALILVVLGVALWRNATNLQGHTRAGAEIIALALSKQMAEDDADVRLPDVQRVHSALPGLGEPVPVTVPPASLAAGRTLGELDLRGTTGATVLTILRRTGEEVVLPNGHEMLDEGDVVFLAGTNHAVKAARSMLKGSKASAETATAGSRGSRSSVAPTPES